MKYKKEKVKASCWKIPGLILLLSCFLDSCQTQKIFTPALYHSDVSYLPKPSSGDSVHHQTYLSGGWGSASGLFNNYQINLYQLDASHAWIFKDFNMAIGAFADLGNVQNTAYTPDSVKKKDLNYFDNKGFSALGARFSMNLYEKVSHFNFRIIGFEATYSHESGDYWAYRKQVINLPNYYTTTQNDLFTLGGTSEIVYEGERHPYNKVGFRLFVGHTFGNFDFLYNNTYPDQNPRKPIFANVALYLQSRRYFFIAEGNSSSNNISTSRIRIGYHF